MRTSKRSAASIGVLLASASPVVVADSSHAGEHGRTVHPRGAEISPREMSARREQALSLRALRENSLVIRTANDVARGNTHSRLDIVPLAQTVSLTQDLAGRNRNSLRILQPPIRTSGSELAGGAYDLDLSSANTDIVIGSRIFNGADSVTITVGGSAKTFAPGARVTAGEFVAIRQVLEGGSQSIGLNNDGIADGGTFAFNQIVSGRVDDVVIPQNVTALDYFSRGPVIRLAGDLTNNGSIYAISQSARVREGRIIADDIVNNASGVISSQLPEALRASLSGAQRSVDLHLDGTGNITNYGIISSSGNLSLTAAGSIANISEPTNGVAGTASSAGDAASGMPRISAVKDIDLSLGNGRLINGGQIISTRGSLNVLAPDATTSIRIDASGGSFSALKGDINVRDVSYAGSADITLIGGDYFSNNLNLHSGTGAIEARVNELTGTLNTNAGVEHLFANTSDLVLGNNCVTGDPTFANNGNITISGVNTFEENVAIIANGDITGNSTAKLIVRGHDVVLLAGVDPGAAAPATGNVTGSPTTGISGTAIVDFASANNKGGNIDLTASTVGTIIDTRDGVASGNVVLAAFAKGTTGGRVLLPTDSTIDTSSGVTPGPGNGPAAGSGGNVTVIAGAAPASATTTIQLGTITTRGSASNFDEPAGKGGSVTIITAQPTATTGTEVTFDSSGSITAGGPIKASSTISANAKVVVNGAITTSLLTGIGETASAAGDVSIHAGGTISTAAILAQGQNGKNGSNGGNPSFASGQTGAAGGSVTVISDHGGIYIDGPVDTRGGSGGKGTFFSQFGIMPYPGGAGGAAGAIDISAGGGVLTVNGDVTASGGAGGTGANNPGTVPNDSAYAGAGGNGGAGANIAISATGDIIVGSLNSAGGAGAAGGFGPDGRGASNPGFPGIAGAIGGQGGDGGGISATFGPGTMTVNGIITSQGGAGGTGGDGGDGGNTAGPGGPAGTNGGSGADGGDGGNGEVISITSPAGTLNVTGDLITAGGGAGGAGGIGGEAFTTGTGGAGGAGGNGGDAAQSMSGGISLLVQNIDSGIDNSGGVAGAGGAGGGSSDGTGKTGASGTTGSTGKFGSVFATTDDFTTSFLRGGLVLIQSDNGGSDILINGDVLATEMLILNGGASGSVIQQSGLITSPSVNATATTGKIILNNLTNGSSSQAISVATAGDVVIKSNSAIQFGTISGDDISITNTAGLDLIVGNNIAGTGVVSLTTAGLINVSSNVTVSGSKINLTGQQLLVSSTGTISGTTIKVESSKITNDGTIQSLAGGVLALDNSNGDLAFSGSGDYKAVTALTASAKGNLDIGGLFQNTVLGVGLNVLLLSGGNISATGTGSFDVDMVGGKVTPSQLNVYAGATYTMGVDGTKITLTGQSATGGSINLATGQTIGSIDTGSADGFGGKVTLIALAGLAKGSGTIALPTSSLIITGGTMGSGSVDIISSAPAGQAITIGAINTSGSVASSGSVLIQSSPVVAGGVVFDLGANNGSGPGYLALSGGSITAGKLTTNLAKIDVNTTGDLTVGDLKANQIALRAIDGKISLQTNKIVADANVPVDGNGGSVQLIANSISYANSSSSAFTIDVRGALSKSLSPGAGGSASITVASSSPLNVGTGSNSFNFLAGGATAGVMGGQVSITNKSGGIINSSGLGDVSSLTETTGGNGSIVVNGALGSSTVQLISLKTGGSGSISGTGVVTAVETNLVAGGSIGSSNKAFKLASTKVVAQAGGAVNLLDTATSPVQLEASSAGSTFKFSSSNSITTAGDITADSSVSLLTTGNNGSITLGGNIIASSSKGQVTIDANGSGNISNASVGITAIKAKTVNLISNSGQLSGPGGGLRVNTSSLNVSTSGGVSVVNLGTSDISVSVLKSLGAVSLVSDANLTIAKAITSASSISLSTSTGSNKNILINASLGAVGVTDSIAINADGSGSITAKSSGKLNTKATGSLTLLSGTGSIGSSKTAIQLNSGVVAANTGGTGVVNLKNLSTSAATLLDSSSGGTFTFATKGALTLNDVSSGGGSIAISNGSGLLKVNAASIISAGNGNIALTSSSTKNGAIEIGANSQISTFSTSKTGGQVTISIGRLKKPVLGTTPANVQVNDVSGGTAFFGNGITAVGPTNIINLVGSNVVFSVGSRPTTAIKLDGGVVITADPVVAPGKLDGGLISSERSVLPTNRSALESPLSNSLLNTALIAQQLTSVPLVEGTNPSAIDFSVRQHILQSAHTALRTPSNLGWISETELASGEIPALVRGNSQLSVQSVESMAVDIVESSESTTNQKRSPLTQSKMHMIPLSSSVSKNENYTRLANLNFGSVLFVPTENTQVDTRFGKIKMHKGAVVLVLSFAEGLSVFALDDTHKRSIVFECAGRSVALTPGSHLTATNNAGVAFEQINPAQLIGHSAITEQQLAQKTKLFTSKFSLPHCMSSVIPLRSILKANDSAARKISNHLLKTASVLMQLNPSITYTQHQRRLGVTAWNESTPGS